MKELERLCQTLNEICPALELRRDEPMSAHTSFRIGGPAALMALPRSAEEAALALRTAAELGVRPFFLGNGTDLLVDDAGVDRFLIKPAGALGAAPLNTACLPEEGLIRAGAGLSLANLARAAWANVLTGLEFAQGIPGTVGGGLTMNAGAYGGELSQVLDSVTALTLTGERLVLSAADCAMGYRRSIFSDGDYLIVEADFRATPGEPEAIKARMEDLAARRREKQPLEYPSAGSAFKRPEGHFAAALIDQCGLKGLTVGGAQVSEKHAGFVINRGGATCADVLALTDQIRDIVREKKGITLELEIKRMP